MLLPHQCPRRRHPRRVRRELDRHLRERARHLLRRLIREVRPREVAERGLVVERASRARRRRADAVVRVEHGHGLGHEGVCGQIDRCILQPALCVREHVRFSHFRFRVCGTHGVSRRGRDGAVSPDLSELRLLHDVE